MQLVLVLFGAFATVVELGIALGILIGMAVREESERDWFLTITAATSALAMFGGLAATVSTLPPNNRRAPRPFLVALVLSVSPAIALLLALPEQPFLFLFALLASLALALGWFLARRSAR